MHRSILSLALLAGVPAVALVGCSTAPESTAGQHDLQREADRSLDQALAVDPTLRPVIQRSAGYAVFPTVGEGGFIIGGGYGKGALYERGQFVGFVDITSVSGGLKIGGQSYSQMIVFETPGPLANFKNGDFTLSADAKAVAVTSGAAANAQFKDNILVYIWDQSGLMADASVGGQTYRFTPADDAAQAAGGWYDSQQTEHRQAEYQGYKDQDARQAGEKLDNTHRDVDVDVDMDKPDVDVDVDK